MNKKIIFPSLIRESGTGELGFSAKLKSIFLQNSSIHISARAPSVGNLPKFLHSHANLIYVRSCCRCFCCCYIKSCLLQIFISLKPHVCCYRVYQGFRQNHGKRNKGNIWVTFDYFCRERLFGWMA